ncbi:MAG: hypothetical protein ABI398_02755 [Devosia sp.]
MNKLAIVAATAATAIVFGAIGALAQSGVDFSQADGNRDGKVSMDEARGIYNTLDTVIFNMADTNHDGMLDEGEYTELQGLVGNQQTVGGSTEPSIEASSSEASSSDPT